MEKIAGGVCLVGAGPGDEGLITVRGLAYLRAADVVIHDALVLPALLSEAKENAELINVGKRHADHKLAQDDINALLVEKAQQGHRVVRLKGGDPFLFGRGAEEAAYVAKHGIPCDIVPGVTAGVAAPAMAGIPVTHRQHASSVTFITGHEDPEKSESAHDYAALAKLVQAGGTLCIYMGMNKLDLIVKRLASEGLPSTTPAAVVQWGASPRQRSVRSTLAKLIADVRDSGCYAPAIVVIGSVAAIDEAGMHAFRDRALFGQSVIITRTRTQASAQRQLLTELGAEVFDAPTIRIDPPDELTWAQIDDALLNLERYDWLVLTSANGVEMLADRMDHLKLDSRALAPVKIAAVGNATGGVLSDRLHIEADLIPRTYVAESLAAELIDAGAANQRLLLLRADIAREALPELLGEAGASIDEFPIYQNTPETALPDVVLERLRKGKVTWITFTSSSTVRNMIALLGDERNLLDNVKVASIGRVTSDTARSLGLTVTVEAEPSNIDGLIDAMVRHDASAH